MSSVSQRPEGPAFPIRGVFPADPMQPPVPPPGWVAREIRDRFGTRMAWTMYPAALDDDDTMAALWAWLDRKDAPSGDSFASPRLVR